MYFSLILPTLGRKTDLIRFVSSLRFAAEKVDNKLELIVIDQNDKLFGLKEVLETLQCDFDIIYIHSDIKGLSYNRNLGLKVCNGKYIAFPDDDCTYYPDTLKVVLDLLDMGDEIDFIVGQIVDVKTNQKIIKNWPEVIKKITFLNYYFLSSSITIFAKFDKNDYFDVSLGAGGLFGSCEDPDFLYTKLLKGKKGIYYPSVKVWHPIPDFSSIDNCKVFNYASGFGYFIRKNISIINFLFLLLLLFKKSMQFIFLNSKFKDGYFSNYFKGLWHGFKGYGIKKR
ncbi:glycosyltransferase family 2 protein [Shewanella sp. Arc9-LZ]|uniref:glycosyltransferase family 2 protein n=1 Tax=Shewanella sp. Arc9-LZ TaxID=2698686 RepID=UPI00137BCCC8|nr:glycosyltransferase family 2 protein [Shewanella sp. Arc9-LZ]QHS14344.1 glycosyltransferase family 2 protein [Shewanella sp. Arc9-LZ]